MSAFRHHAHQGCAGASRVSTGSGPFAFPGTERRYEASRPFQIRHLALDLALDFKAKSVSGTATLDFERRAGTASVIELDAHGFRIGEVTLVSDTGPELSAFDYDGERLSVELSAGFERGSLRIRYQAWPRRGLYFLAPDKRVKDRPVQVWSQCQDEDARHWFPCIDRPHVKMTSELRVEVPNGMVALSNGRLLEELTPEAPKPWTYHFLLDKPHPSYLVTLVAGHFSIRRDAAKDPPVPVRYYLPPGRERDGERALGRTPQMIELFSRLTGVPYPWGTYSEVVVHDFVFGGMENTGATTLYEHTLLDKRAALDIESDDLVAHELAHQWFGNYVTCRDWSEAWLNEGFATFCENIERESRLGRDEYDYRVLGDLDAYLTEAGTRYQRPIVCRDYGEPIDLFDRHLYEKGGLVLHMLRRELGDDTFWRSVRLYLERHAHGIVETADLKRALEESSGRSFERFFDEWVYRPGHPELKVTVSWEKGLLSVRVRQTQKGASSPCFELPIEVEIGTHDGGLRRKKTLAAAEDVLAVELSRRPEWVAFDPDQRIMGSVELSAPSEFLRRALESGSSASIRLRAARALARRCDTLSLQALGASLGREAEAWMVRVEAARALGEIRGPECFEQLKSALGSDEPRVRRAVVVALGQFRTKKSAKLLLPLAHRDPSYLVQADAARSLGLTRHAGDLAALTAGLEQSSWADVVRAGALDGLAATRDERALEWIERSTAYGMPTRARRSAIRALPKASQSERVRSLLEDLLDDENPHVRVDVAGALSDLGNARSKAALERRLAVEDDGRVKRRLHEAASALDKTPEGRRYSHEELVSLKDEVTQLRLRLSKLEARTRGEKDARTEVRDGAKTTARVSEAKGTRATLSFAGRKGKQARKNQARRTRADRGQAKAKPETRRPAAGRAATQQTPRHRTQKKRSKTS